MPRFSTVDALRGLIMMLMAIDHANAYVARQHGGEFWNGAMATYSSSFAFLTRLVTHLCAPGFFFLMGAGIYWFASSRMEAGWSVGQTVRRTAVRGFAILMVGQILETPVLYMQTFLKPPALSLVSMPMGPPNDGLPPFVGFITLSGLGVVMMLCSLLLPLRPVAWLGASGLAVVLTHTLLPASGKVGPLWFTVLLAPGLTQHVFVIYPVIPWLAVAAFGMYFGYLWRQHPTLRDRLWVMALAMIGVALALRAIGGWGNILPPRDGGWLEFFNNVKYPPSLVFWTLSVGVDLLLLALLMRLPVTGSRSPLMVFGQTTLFFYVVHFYVLEVFALALFQQAAPLEVAYVVWLAVLAMMYPLCLRYRTFKMQQPPESIWRLF